MKASTVEVAAGSRLSDYLELAKPRLSSLVVATTVVGYLTAVPTAPDPLRLLATLLGTTLVVAGANALNQLLERDTDALMTRTRDRPLPAGRLWAPEALAFGVLLGISGMLLMASLVNLTAAALALAGYVLYAFVYTPLKRVTPLCTLVGAVPGAIPPLIGWSAATGSIEPGGLALFGILFFWQLPHFLAIARLNREDYARAGMPMQGVGDESGRPSGSWMVVYTAALFPVALLPTFLGVTGSLYLLGVGALGLGFVAAAAQSLLRPSRAADRKTFFFSLVYLTVLLMLMVLDSRPGA